MVGECSPLDLVSVDRGIYVRMVVVFVEVVVVSEPQVTHF